MNMFVTFQKFFSSFELLAFDSLSASAARSLPTGLDLSSGHVVSTCLFEDLARATGARRGQRFESLQVRRLAPRECSCTILMHHLFQV